MTTSDAARQLNADDATRNADVGRADDDDDDDDDDDEESDSPLPPPMQ